MNEVDAVIFLKDTLIEQGITATIDRDTDPKTPFVWIDLDRAEPDEHDATGIPMSQTTFISVTCVVAAQNKKAEVYKREAGTFAREVMDKLHAQGMLGIVENKKGFDDILIGSLKCSAVTVECEIQTT